MTAPDPPKTRGRPPGDRPLTPELTSSHTAAAPAERLTAAPDCMVAHDGDGAAGMQAWRLAVEHLHGEGLPAAVPELVGARLRRGGVPVDWSYSGRWVA